MVAVPAIDPLSTRYLRLALELDQHIAGLVDAYTGPAALREAVQAQPPRAAAGIADELAALREDVQQSSYPTRRKAYLEVQLVALHTLARKQAGAAISYRDEVRACFDIEPQHVDEAQFEAAHEELDALLPRTTPAASLNERYAAWRSQYAVPPAVAAQLIERIAAEARTRTHAMLPLPTGEQAQFALVQDKPWSGYNWYLGQAQSRVEINTDLPIYAHSLLDLVCHEAYPGHHTEHALKEQRLYHQQGWGEHAIQLINTPECVISEGIAMLAADAIFGEDAYTWAAAELYPLAGIVGNPQHEQQIATARRHMRALTANAALLLHEQGAPPAEVVAYLLRYGMGTAAEAEQQVRFISHPLWRTYIFTYYVGRDLLARWLARGNRHERFTTLLTEQLAPGWVEQQVLAEAHACLRD